MNPQSVLIGLALLIIGLVAVYFGIPLYPQVWVILIGGIITALVGASFIVYGFLT